MPRPHRRWDDAPATSGRSRAKRDVRAAAGADAGHLGLVVELVGAQLVGPHARGVDHARGITSNSRRWPRRAPRPGGATVALHQPADLEPVGAHGAEALGLAQHGEHEPGVVGLAVVEQVAGRRLADASAGSSSATSSP